MPSTVFCLFVFCLFPRLGCSFPICHHHRGVDDDDEGVAESVLYLRNSVFGHPSRRVGRRLENYDPNHDLANPEELGVYAEGDILFPFQTRNGLVSETLRWHHGVIPYEIDPTCGEEFKMHVLKAMYQYHYYTCVRFQPKTDADTDWVWIQCKKEGCWASVGKTGGKQSLNLQIPACTTKLGTAVHELMHTIGFVHEQSAADRDNYVDILWDNIRNDRVANFKKFNQTEVTAFDVGYDYYSVMHYSKYAFSKNKEPTIEPKVKGVEIGQRIGFSKKDISKINAMYMCY